MSSEIALQRDASLYCLFSFSVRVSLSLSLSFLLSFHPLFHSRFVDEIAFSLGSASWFSGRNEHVCIHSRTELRRENTNRYTATVIQDVSRNWDEYCI